MIFELDTPQDFWLALFFRKRACDLKSSLNQIHRTSSSVHHPRTYDVKFHQKQFRILNHFHKTLTLIVIDIPC